MPMLPSLVNYPIKTRTKDTVWFWTLCIGVNNIDSVVVS